MKWNYFDADLTNTCFAQSSIVSAKAPTCVGTITFLCLAVFSTGGGGLAFKIRT